MRRIVTNERMRAMLAAWAFLPAVVFGVLLHIVPVAAAVPDGSIVREELLKEYSREWIEANALSTRPEFRRVLTPPVAEGVRALGAAHNGVRLYAVGLGADVDAATLLQMVGDVSRYRFAPDSADLARIYAEIAGDILCPAPPGGFWPWR